MRRLDLTIDSAAQQIAVDEALFLESESRANPHEWLRIWEPTSPMVVVGRSSSRAAEVDLAACREDGVPVFRRVSGGASIVAAPGCLMYAVVLSYDRWPALRMISQSHQFVLERLIASLAALNVSAEMAGTSDLVVEGRKVSGNSLRCCRTHLLYHGTLLCNMNLPLVARYLRMPNRQPDYRQNRSHESFLANMNVSLTDLRAALTEAWGNPPTAESWPVASMEKLVREKYCQESWNGRLP